MVSGSRGREDQGVDVRHRLDEDFAELERLAEVVHEVDGYPLYLPTDLRGFLVSSEAHGAWVARRDGALIGHIALHPGSWEGVMELGRAATGLTDESLAVVARLLVAPSARRHGIGRVLLRTATTQAHRIGLRPILDVAVKYTSAIQLYEDEGWERVGSVQFPMPDGQTVEEYVYLGPSPV